MACVPPHATTNEERVMKRLVLQGALSVALTTAPFTAAHAHPDVSEASALSALPIAVSVAAPAMFISAGAMLTVVAVEATATGAVWVMERASDGARASITVAGGLSVVA